MSLYLCLTNGDTMNFEDLLQLYAVESGDHTEFLLNALLTVLLSWILSLYYKRYGKSVGNRSSFSNNFMLLALTTMLIIYIVKSSIALSLGLVGALSIVRFRAAVKEPEELTYLFLVIGIGLGMGAGQAGITLLAFVLIISLLFIRSKLARKLPFSVNDQMMVSISTDEIDESKINSLFSSNFDNVELRRLSKEGSKLFMTYVLEVKNFEEITKIKNELIALAPNLEFSFVDNKNVIG